MKIILAALLSLALILVSAVVIQPAHLVSRSGSQQQRQALKEVAFNAFGPPGHMTIAQEQARELYLATFPQLLCHAGCPD